MNISQVIKFEGSPDELVWKFPLEEMNTTSQLIVDETHEALLVINGNAADLFPPGRRTLSLPNIPLASKLINIPTDGVSPFPTKVFFINKVHQMDLLWGTQGPITLEDPEYNIFMHVMLHGNMSVAVEESRKFMLKFVGFRDSFDAETLVSKFRGIISSYVKSYISKIMINGKLSYFKINASLFEVSQVVKEQLDTVFEEYGIRIMHFNIENITVPDSDYEAITQSKERQSSRNIEGYTWQEERQMDISEAFASNEGTMGNVGGAMGGFMMGSAMGGTVSDIARNALSSDRIPDIHPPKNAVGSKSPMGGAGAQPFDVDSFFSGGTGDNGDSKEPVQSSPDSSPTEKAPGNNPCGNCNAPLPPDAMFCSKCGQKVGRHCTNCGTELAADAKFCHKCGTPTDEQ